MKRTLLRTEFRLTFYSMPAPNIHPVKHSSKLSVPDASKLGSVQGIAVDHAVYSDRKPAFTRCIPIDLYARLEPRAYERGSGTRACH